MEELKLILETVNELGGSAKWLFIFYLVKNFLTSAIGYGCLLFGIFAMSKILKDLIGGFSLIQSIKAKMGISTDDILNPYQKQTILKTIDKGLNKE